MVRFAAAAALAFATSCMALSASDALASGTEASETVASPTDITLDGSQPEGSEGSDGSYDFLAELAEAIDELQDMVLELKNSTQTPPNNQTQPEQGVPTVMSRA
ncbi:hypothetical protein ACQRIU_003909 [Beauveria bassiana]